MLRLPLVLLGLIGIGCESGSGGGDADSDVDVDADADSDSDSDADTDSDSDADTDSDSSGTTIEGELLEGGTYVLPLTCAVRLFHDVGALSDSFLFQEPVSVNAWPEPYVLDDVFGPRSGYVGVICDTNGDGSVDVTDTAGGWYGDPTYLSEPATGVDLTVASL